MILSVREKNAGCIEFNSAKGGYNGYSSQRERKVWKSYKKNQDEKERTEKETTKKGREKEAFITTNDPFPQRKRKKIITAHELNSGAALDASASGAG